MSTLSVETSNSGSSTSTESPTFFSHAVMVPSVTDSPSSGISTSTDLPPPLPFGASNLADSSGSAAGSSSSTSGSSAASGSESACSEPDSSPGSPTRAITSPTSTVSSSSKRISVSTPATGEGISVSTLSVETSSSGSSTSTVSPTFFSQVVIVPSVTDSPSSGISIEVAMFVHSSKVRFLVLRRVFRISLQCQNCLCVGSAHRLSKRSRFHIAPKSHHRATTVGKARW